MLLSLRPGSRLLLAGLLGLLVEGSALAQLVLRDAVAQPAFSNVLSTVQRRVSRPEVPPELARVTATTDGSLGFLAAPPDHHFVLSDFRPASPADAAVEFLRRTRELLGVRSAAVGFVPGRTRSRRSGQAIVPLQQTYGRIPVYGAQVKVQVNADGGVEALISDVARNTDDLDSGALKTTPRLTGDQAVEALRTFLAREFSGIPIRMGLPGLVLYDPTVIGRDGAMRLAWRIEASSDDGVTLDEEFLVHALDGEVLNRFTRLHSALNREVYDASNSTNNPGSLVRSEGQPATGIADVDNAYRFYADAYNFYLTRHGRDSYDGDGALLSITCRYCNTNLPSGGCAFRPQNGMWSSKSKRMFFGPGVVADDVVGHELTHGVTGEESGLIYQNASGAINESFSDLWGEFIDLTNGFGNDAPEVRWLVGEDWVAGGIRDMEDPVASNQPDRLGSALYQPSSDTSDNGGVHTNSGVNNRLCSLLTDGGTFNGQTVTGFGLGRIAELYYATQTGLLPAGADWTDLFNALGQAAVDLDWTVLERNNLYRACLAVEIAATRFLWVNGWANCPVPNGQSQCLLPIPFFLPEGAGPFPSLVEANAAAIPGDTLRVVAGTYPAPLVFNKRLRFRTEGGSVVIGQ